MIKRFEEFWRLRAAYYAVSRFPIIKDKVHHRLSQPLIVTLTSYPARYPTLALTLKSLLDQTVAADRTILWIAHDDLAALPDDVRTLTQNGLEIRTCDDLRSFKKLVPALRNFPDAILVTADDDLYYPPSWLANLINEFDVEHPSIIAVRAHLAKVDADGFLGPYNTWTMATHEVTDVPPDRLLFPTGCSGVLYPAGAFPDIVFDDKIFLTLCPQADDLWFFWLAEQAGIPHKRVPGDMPLITWKSSQIVGLLTDNVYGSGNDRQIKALQNALGVVGKCNNVGRSS